MGIVWTTRLRLPKKHVYWVIHNNLLNNDNITLRANKSDIIKFVIYENVVTSGSSKTSRHYPKFRVTISIILCHIKNSECKMNRILFLGRWRFVWETVFSEKKVVGVSNMQSCSIENVVITSLSKRISSSRNTVLFAFVVSIAIAVSNICMMLPWLKWKAILYPSSNDV